MKLFGPSLLAWRVLRLVVDVAVALLAYVLIRRRAGEGWALAGWLATAGAMAFPAGPGPNATALALGLGAIALAPRRALIAGRARGARVLLPGRDRRRVRDRGDPRGAARPRRASPARRWRSPRSTLGPFVALLGGDMLPQTVGFVDEQRLQRLPFPLWPHVGFDPNKLLEFWMPLILVAGLRGLGCCSAAGAGRSRRSRSSGSPTCSRAPTSTTWCRLSVALAVLLACAAAARARRRHALCSPRCSR